MTLIDSTISREKVEIPMHLKISMTPLGQTFGKEKDLGSHMSYFFETSVSPVETWCRIGKLAYKITHTPCPPDPKQNSLQLWRRRWGGDGSCEQRECVHYVWLRLSRQRDIWRDPGFQLGGMRVRLLSMWFHWRHLRDHLSEGKPPVPCWVCLDFLRVSLGFQRRHSWRGMLLYLGEGTSK